MKNGKNYTCRKCKKLWYIEGDMLAKNPEGRKEGHCNCGTRFEI